MNISFSVLCPTFRRMQLLEEVIDCFFSQDYSEQAEMIILDDAGDWAPANIHKNNRSCQIISIERRFASLGEKRNALLGLASLESNAIAFWDDDDLYLPHALTAMAAALERGELAYPSAYLEQVGNACQITERKEQDFCLPSWGFSRELLKNMGGFPPISYAEDGALITEIFKRGFRTIDPIRLGFEPYYIHRRPSNTYHLSGKNRVEYSQLTKEEAHV